LASPRRIEKVNVLIREVIALILSRDVHFPEGALVTVTRISTSEDLYYAAVFISVLAGDETKEKEVLDQLRRSAGEIQHELNKRLRMRPVPRITFAIDEEEKRRERVEKLLSEG